MRLKLKNLLEHSHQCEFSSIIFITVVAKPVKMKFSNLNLISKMKILFIKEKRATSKCKYLLKPTIFKKNSTLPCSYSVK